MQVLEQHEAFLEKLNFAIQNCFEAEEDQFYTGLNVIEDLCKNFKKESYEFGKRGDEEKKATGGEIDVEALKEQGISDLVSSAIECQSAGLNPAMVLSNAIKKNRGETEKNPLVYAFSPQVIRRFEGIEVYIQ